MTLPTLYPVFTHTGHFSCERCVVEGRRSNNTTVFEFVNHEKRTHQSFLNFDHLSHHVGVSPFIGLDPTKINFIDHSILDSMHLVYLGVTLRLLDYWLNITGPSKLSADLKKELNLRTETVISDIPVEFKRKMRSSDFYALYKATDL